MNERIKELATQAGHRYIPSSNSGPLRVEYLTPELEKFAELIVRECVNVIRADYVDLGTTAAVNNIEKHFGVEE